MKIRQSMIGNADKCLRSLQYSIETPEYRSGSLRAVGTATHFGLEGYYGERLDGWVDPIEYLPTALDRARECLHDEVEQSGKHFIWGDPYPDMASAMAGTAILLTTYLESSDAVWGADYKILGTEYQFTLPYPGRPDLQRTGTMDLLIETPEGWLLGDDHKTVKKNMWPKSKHLPRKNTQAPYYVGALMDAFPGYPGYLFSFSIITPGGKFERRVSRVAPEHVQATLDRGAQVADLYTTLRAKGIDLPGNPSSNLCSPEYCDYWEGCDFGAALDFEQGLQKVSP